MTTSLLPAWKYQVQETQFDASGMKDELNFYSNRQGQPSELSKKLTYIMGDYSKLTPLSQMTLGGVGFGNKQSAVELDDPQFTYPVIGHMDKASVIYSTEYSDGDKPGLGGSIFYLTFADEWIKRFYVIQSENGTQAYVHEKGEPAASGGFRYKCTLVQAGPADYLPTADWTPQTKWVDLFTGVAESESRSTESKSVMPGLFKNQMGFMRGGTGWAGNAANKVMKIDVTVNGQSTSVWMDYFMWQFEQRWMMECEHQYWYSRYNRKADGTIDLKDLVTGKVIPMASGVLEQITNKGTFSTLTYKTLRNKIGDALFGQADTAGMNITLWGGTGARRDMDEAVRKEGGTILAGFGGGNIADKFVTGTGGNLALGGFFDAFYHIDGYYIKFKYNPIYDIGKIAKASPLHPVSGLPLESHRMTFIDDSDVDGQPNIRHVAQKGRAFLQGVCKGLTPTPRSIEIMLGNSSASNVSGLLSHVDDKSEYTRFRSSGIQLMRGNRCFDLQCVAGQ